MWRGLRIVRAMRKWLEKLQAKLRASEGDADGNAQPVPATPGPEESQPAPGPGGHDSGPPVDPTDPTIMLEILKTLSRIEYGLDEQELAEALGISAELVLANCQALEEEMFVHHHGELAKWFIGQRGLEFLRLNEHAG